MIRGDLYTDVRISAKLAVIDTGVDLTFIPQADFDEIKMQYTNKYGAEFKKVKNLWRISSNTPLPSL